MSMEKNRFLWIDRVKLIACILVLAGHYISGLVLSNIINSNNFILWFGKTIYYFHVPLFFICSGFLYQRFTKIESCNDWKKNVIKKLVNLGIPYFVFTFITIFLKIIASSSVNTQIDDSLWTILFLNPIAPYWYLYVLFYIFVFTLPFKNKKHGKIMITVSLVLKIIACMLNNFEGYESIPYFIRGIFINEIWFVSGMYLALNKEWYKYKLSNYKLLFIINVEILFSIIIFKCNLLDNELVEFVLGAFICYSIFSFCIKINDIKEGKIEKILINNTMPIFLMHTIFAAGIRVILIKLNITSFVIHLILGLLSSIVLPIVVAYFLDKIPYGNLLLYPSKVIGGKR